jgi:hypothetical protein
VPTLFFVFVRLPLIVTGPGPDLPLCPRNTLGPKDVPWADGKDSTNDYYPSVISWCKYLDMLSENYPSKLGPNVRGILLKATLYAVLVHYLLVSTLPGKKINKRAEGLINPRVYGNC